MNIEEAKKLQMYYFRRVRKGLLRDLDVDFLRAIELEDISLQKEIASKKQALRDVTKIDLPNTLEEIKATWPEILGENPFNKIF